MHTPTPRQYVTLSWPSAERFLWATMWDERHLRRSSAQFKGIAMTMTVIIMKVEGLTVRGEQRLKAPKAFL